MLKSIQAKLPFQFSPKLLAVVMALLLALWLLSGDRYRAAAEPPAAQRPLEPSAPLVETRWLTAQPLARQQVLQGQILPWQQVRVQAQVAGRVEALLKQQGDTSARGDALLQLSDEGRSQQLQQARAELRLRTSELEGARALQSSRLVSSTELARLESELARAQAALASAELAAAYNRPSAPFAGVVDRRHVELGQFVQAGTDLMTLVDVARLRVTAQVPQQDAAQIAVGQRATVKLLDGRSLPGEVRFISLAADAETRSFYLEVEAANPELWRVAGASATLHIELPNVLAHRVSPALLSLDAEGRTSVRAVDAGGQVVVYPVRVIAVDTDSATLAGLPERVQIITQGAGFVAPGQLVQVKLAAVGVERE